MDELRMSLPEPLREGVRFACTRCGACCTGDPGRVVLTSEELKALSAYLGLPEAEVRARYLKAGTAERLLREQENGDCIFFAEGLCTIQAVKPGQCQRYPFWFRNVRSEAAWAKTVAACPGIGEGPWISPEVLVQKIQEDMEAGGCAS